MSGAPVVIISGYLGAGKTTLINRILSAGSAGVWVLVNDFGSVNIDSSLICNVDGNTMELTNGCICCAFDDDLGSMLRTARDAQPAMVIIETSGVADPGTLTPHTRTPGFRPGGTIVVVDGNDWGRLSADRLVGRTVTRQVSAADMLVVTKAPVTPALVSALRPHNPGAPVVGSDAVDIASIVLLDRPTPVGTHDNPHVQTVEHPHVTTVDEAGEWLRTLPAGVVRVKGIVALAEGTHLLERVGSGVAITPTDAPPSDGVVVISLARN